MEGQGKPVSYAVVHVRRYVQRMRHDGSVRYPMLLVLSALTWAVVTAPVLIGVATDAQPGDPDHQAGLLTSGLALVAVAVLWPRRTHAPGGSAVRGLMFVALVVTLGMVRLLPAEHGLAWWPLAAAVMVLLSFVVQLFSTRGTHDRVNVLAESICASLVVALGAGWFVWVQEINVQAAHVNIAVYVAAGAGLLGMILGAWLVTWTQPKALGRVPAWRFAVAGACGVAAMGMPAALATRYLIL